jgi:putative IMPACT (imprinted ancient) family translation regulator
LTHVLFAVVRYFGGTKLGVGGLIEAYREGAAEALRAGQVVERIRTQRIRIAFAYEHMGVIMGLIKRWELQPASTDFQISCALDVDVRLGQVEGFVQTVQDTRVAEVEAL